MNLSAMAGYTPESVAFNFYDRKIILRMAPGTPYGAVTIVKDLFLTAVRDGIPHVTGFTDFRIVLCLQFGYIKFIIMAVPAYFFTYISCICAEGFLVAANARDRFMTVRDFSIYMSCGQQDGEQEQQRRIFSKDINCSVQCEISRKQKYK